MKLINSRVLNCSKLALSLLLVALGVLPQGCASTKEHAVKARSTPLARAGASQVLPVRVGLVMDSAWRGYTPALGSEGQGIRYPMGDTLVDYARNVVAHSFRESLELPDAAAAKGQVDVVAEPKPVKMEQMLNALAWQDRTAVLRVEWMLKDAGTGQTLWLDTIEAEASHVGGNAFTYKRNEQIIFKKLIDDLTAKTVTAFEGAGEALKRRPGSER